MSRLLALVPWLLAHPGVTVEEAAHHFAISPAALVEDLELLFVCGTPGHAPDDLIEADWEDGVIHLGNADAIARPLRLALDEAVALIAGLRTLVDVPGAGDRDVLLSALAKLSQAAGDAAAAAAALSPHLGSARPAAPAEGADILATVREGLRDRRRLHLTYLVPSRDETTHRDVDPMRLLTVDGHWYLEGWCHAAQGVRLFRLDRVLALHLTGLDGTPPAQARARDVDEVLFTPSEQDRLVTLRLAPGARWRTEQVPLVEEADLPDGSTRVRLRTADDRWLRRLLLSSGGEVVAEDADLAAAVAATAAAALAAYDTP